VSLLVDEVGNSLFALAGEIDKLVTYAGDRKTIEPADVAQLTGHTRNWVVWSLTDALACRDVAGLFASSRVCSGGRPGGHRHRRESQLAGQPPVAGEVRARRRRGPG